MRTAAALIGVLLLGACGSDDPVVTSTKYRVVIPEESMFACDTVERFPESRTLTDLQVARLLVELHQNNVRCRNSVQAIRQFLEDSRARIETGEEPSPQSAPQRRVPIRP